MSRTPAAIDPGIYCTVELTIPRVTPSLIVQASAIVFNHDSRQVLMAENGIVRHRKITETRDLGVAFEVDDGVRAGEELCPTRWSI
jgi:hypothetical protein